MRGRLQRATVVLSLVVACLATARPAAGEVADGWDYRSLSIAADAIPLVGQFTGDAADDIFWYVPGSGADSLWVGHVGRRGADAFTRIPMTVNGSYRPIVADVAGDDYADILWYAPGTAPDSLWVSTNTPGTFAPEPVTIDGWYQPSVLRDFTSAERKDDILWYAPGSAPDSLWHLAEDGSFDRTTVPLSITASYRVVVGDWNGDKLEDVMLYAPGDGADQRWTSRADGRFRAGAYNIGGDYQPVTIYQPGGDGIFWWQSGTPAEAYWVSDAKAFRRAPVPARSDVGIAVSAGLQGAVVAVGAGPEAYLYAEPTRASWYGLAGAAHDIGAGRRPLIGDYDGDGYIDIVWYGPGGLSDALWYIAPTVSAQRSRQGAGAVHATPSPTRP